MAISIKIFLLVILVPFDFFRTLATPDDIQLTWRNKRSNANHSEAEYDVDEEETVTNGSVILDLCDPDSGRSRRSIQNPLNDSVLNETTVEPEVQTKNISHLSSKFMKCTHIDVEPECYEERDNESVFVPVYNMLFDKSNYLIDDEGYLFICSDVIDGTTGEVDKFSTNISIISLVGAIISTICLVLHNIVFIVVKESRNLPRYCLLSLCNALLIAYVSSFVQHAVDDDVGCTIMGMLMLYFFLASFFWMNVFSYDVWKSIRLATAKLRLTTNRPIMIRFLRYSLYAWGTPLIIMFSSIIIHYSTSDIKYQLVFNSVTCWFQYKQALTLYFAGPLFTLIGINFFFFASSFYMIASATMNKSQVKRKENSDLWTRLFLALKLSSVMGLMWIFGLLAAVTRQYWLWYPFALCSALQGGFIFFSFTMSEKGLKLFRKALQSRKYSSAPTQTSSQQTSSIGQANSNL